jgi:diguanylate cyclase
MVNKKNNGGKEAPNGTDATKEFNERVSRLLVVCLDGIIQMVPQKEALYSALKTLCDVVRKATRPKPLAGMGKDIEDFFKRQALETKFRETKNETVKQIVIDLSETIRQISSTADGFDEKMESSMEGIQSASSIEDIITLKDGIIKEIVKVRINSQSLKSAVTEYKKTTESLSSKLEETEAKALVDSLTNVLNRNAYNMKIIQMIREFSQSKSYFCLLVLDIDHFKKFNDTYGHKAGDRVLKSVAASVQDSLRASDLVFRYGGEEFVVILSNIQEDNAFKLAEKIRKGVEREYFVDKEKKLKVTISLGVACVSEGETELELFERADKAMYVAKRKGRNRVEIAEK